MNLIKGIKAKLRDKSNLPLWFDKRIAVCNECPHNSKNNFEISLKNKLRIAHNMGKDACLICSCGIKDLASDPTIRCSASPPKWDWIQPPNFDVNFNLENHSPSTGRLIKEGKYYFYNFGDIDFNSKNLAILLFVAENELESFKVTASCGCTKPSFVKNNKGYTITVSYDTSIVGPFEKQVSISYINKENNKEFYTFWIKGNVLEF